MVLDLGRKVVHSFTPGARIKYDLEGLWNSIADPSDVVSAESHVEDEDGEVRRLLASVKSSWAGRPKSSVKTKQLESIDFMTEDEFMKRMNSNEVSRSP